MYACVSMYSLFSCCIGEWDFDYVFYTESDQILMTRILPYMYDSLRKYPSRMLLPHRLMAYSTRIMKEIHKKADMLSPKPQEDWVTSLSCCIGFSFFF